MQSHFYRAWHNRYGSVSGLHDNVNNDNNYNDKNYNDNDNNDNDNNDNDNNDNDNNYNNNDTRYRKSFIFTSGLYGLYKEIGRSNVKSFSQP